MKSSHLGPKSVQRHAATAVSTRASERREASEKQVKTDKKQTVAKDGFETGHMTQAELSGAAISAAKREAHPELKELIDQGADRASQLSNVVQAINDKTQALNAQFSELKTQSQAAVQQLADAGFSPQAILHARPILDELRGQMSQMRKRVNWGQRRSNALRAGMHNIPGLDLTALQNKKVGNAMWQQGIKLIANNAKLIPGRSVDGQTVTRLPLGPAANIDRHALGQYLAQISPSAMGQRLTTSLIEAGRALKIKSEVDPELAPLDQDVRQGRAGKVLQGLAQIAHSFRD